MITIEFVFNKRQVPWLHTLTGVQLFWNAYVFPAWMNDKYRIFNVAKS